MFLSRTVTLTWYLILAVCTQFGVLLFAIIVVILMMYMYLSVSFHSELYHVLGCWRKVSHFKSEVHPPPKLLFFVQYQNLYLDLHWIRMYSLLITYNDNKLSVRLDTTNTDCLTKIWPQRSTLSSILLIVFLDCCAGSASSSSFMCVLCCQTKSIVWQQRFLKLLDSVVQTWLMLGWQLWSNPLQSFRE